MTQDIVTIHRAATIGEADVIAAWLENEGIPAFVRNELSVVTLHVPVIAAPKGVEICVAPEDADEARRLLAARATEAATRDAALASAPPIEAVCEQCGTTWIFPATAAGSVQTCEQCRAYLDVPEV